MLSQYFLTDIPQKTASKRTVLFVSCANASGRTIFVLTRRIALVLTRKLFHDDDNSPKKDELPILHQQFVFQAIHQYCTQWSGYQY